MSARASRAESEAGRSSHVILCCPSLTARACHGRARAPPSGRSLSNASSSAQWRSGLTTAFAALAPLSTTAGTPIPGNTPSPQRCSRPQGVRPSAIRLSAAAPYVPLGLRLNDSCVSGEPTSATSARARASGITRSTASQSACARASLSAAYGAPLLRRPSHGA